MINAETLKGVRRGAILINTGRGGLVDDQAVADALESGQARCLLCRRND